MRTIKTTLKKLTLTVIAILLAATASLQPVLAQSAPTGEARSDYYTENDVLYYDPTAQQCGAELAATHGLEGNDNAYKAYNYFLRNHQLKPVQAAAIVGNFMAESGVNPKALNSIGAWGIAQWLGGRKAGLFKWADATKYDSIPDPRRDLLVQLDWAWYELSHSEKKALTDLTKHTDPKEIRAAAKEFEGNFERSGGALLEKRADFAEQILKKYGNVAAAVGEASGDFGCAVAGEIGGCDAIDAPNRLVQVACAEWQKKIVEDVSMNCDSKKRINAYNVVAGFGNSCGPKQPYCAMFMMYVHKTAGYPLAGTNALAISWRDAYRAKGAWIDRRNGAKPPTPGGAVVYTSGNSYHVGMVVKVNTGARTMDTIEANTSTDSQSPVQNA
ncbi:hypothetical protein TM7_0474 [candidate division TM7 genomosp. GTL1]|nr:hypothetical protein TM7_0474 [candidate division TM7 genomosp. GTL1]